MASIGIGQGVRALILRLRLWSLRRAGLQIGADCSMGSLRGFPAFGSEPYLVSIGDHVGFGPGVMFVTHDGGTSVITREPQYRHVLKYGRVTIHDNSFIGQNVLLMPGAEVGPNSIVGAGSVVTRATPPNSVLAGSPARVVMSIEEYAQRSLATSPDVDVSEYGADKRRELLNTFPRPW